MRQSAPENRAIQAAPGLHECPVQQIDEVARGIFLMRLVSPEISRAVRPGQFVNVRIRQEPVPLLRRPFSVCRADAGECTFELLWKAVGAGTELLARAQPGDRLDVLGPLGRGFILPEAQGLNAIVAAGGLGIAPMPLLVEHLGRQGIPARVLIGARTSDELWGADILAAQGVTTRLATDDGSSGTAGLVTALLQEELQQPDSSSCEVFACGPLPMLSTVANLCRQAGARAQLSIETVMGCGFGICLGCPVEPAIGVARAGRYYLACTDGPVFPAESIRLL